MGVKLLWTGLTMILFTQGFHTFAGSVDIAGIVLMVIGTILNWLDR